MSWEVIVGRNEIIIPVKTFKEACKILYSKEFIKKIKDILGGRDLGILKSTSVRIENATNDKNPTPIHACDAEKIVNELKWRDKRGKWTG